MAEIGKRYDLHPLLLEDVLNTQQKPKDEQYEEVLIAVLKMRAFNPYTREVEQEPVSLVLCPTDQVPFQEQRNHDGFDPCTQLLRVSRGKHAPYGGG